MKHPNERSPRSPGIRSRFHPSLAFAALFAFGVSLSFSSRASQENQKQPMGGVSTGAAITYTSRRTVGVVDPAAPVVYEDVTKNSGLAVFKHRSGGAAKDYI